MLFHATYRPYLDSILAVGLGSPNAIAEQNYEDSKKGVVYLATSHDVAVSYAEASDVVPEEWLDDIVVLAIDDANLDASKLFSDRNVLRDDSEEAETVEYHGVVLPQWLTLHQPSPGMSP